MIAFFAMSLQEFTQRFYQLTPKPKTVFILLMEGKDDGEIGTAIAAKETTVRKHIQNLCDHFAIAVEPGEGKQQRRLRLLEQGRGYLGPLLQVESEITPATLAAESFLSKPTETTELGTEINPDLETILEVIAESETSNLRYENWDGAAHLPEMLGRQEEIKTLEKWLTLERCRVVSIVGLKGSGKTTLGVKVAQIAKTDFTVLRWRSLAQGPSLMQLLDDWTNEIVPHRAFSLVASLSEQISQFLRILKEHRCLLILDDFETLLQPQSLAGKFQPIYQDYQPFLQRVSEEDHQSCLLIISQEKLKCLTLAEGARLPVRSLLLGGLGNDAKSLLKSLGMKLEKSWEILINQCGDYPLSLILVTSVIQDLFAGDVAQFLAFNAHAMTEENWQLINTQLERLAEQEWNLIYPLALSPNAFSLSDFQHYFK
ncbi:MAG: NB-ARC domain-containing protein, partial [Microcystaceae cyanobacterium]